jgi:hypothetical protein
MTAVDEEGVEWESGLCNCCGSCGDCCCVVAACSCPSLGYGLNYSLAVQKENDLCTCCLPCCIHTMLDVLVSAILGYCFSIPYLVLPVSTTIRIMQRSIIERRKEALPLTCMEELFCWGCSIGEMHRRLRAREEQGLPPYEGNAILGTLNEPPPSLNGQW